MIHDRKVSKDRLVPQTNPGLEKLIGPTMKRYVFLRLQFQRSVKLTTGFHPSTQYNQNSEQAIGRASTLIGTQSGDISLGANAQSRSF